MSVCLRCDWRGDGRPTACPRCGEPLFRPEPPRRARRSSPLPDGTDVGAVHDVADAPRHDVARHDAPRDHDDAAFAPRGSRVGAVALPVAFLLVIVVVTIATGGAADEAPVGPSDADVASSSVGPPPPPLSGSLVYSRLSPSADRVQLWLWDLADHEVDEGPIVAKPVQLVASTAGVGLTWRRDDGALEAALVDPADPRASPEPLLRGDLVAWSPRGARVSAATLRRGEPCPRPVGVRAVRLDGVARRVPEQTFRMATCGDILSLAGDSSVTYFTLRVGSRVHVAYGGISRPTIVLRDHALLGVSWAGDMIVQRTRGPASGSLAYFNRRTTAPAPMPVPFGGDPSFAFGGVLAWAPNAFEALVVGTSAGRPSPISGVYVLDTLPGDGIDPPRWVMEASGPTSATYTRDGIGIVLTGGDVFAIDDGRVSEVPLPIGAPLADGRVAWIP